jgi:hypothetical protein
LFFVKAFFNHFADEEGELQPDKFFELVLSLQPASANLNPANLKSFLFHHFNMSFEDEKSTISKFKERKKRRGRSKPVK